MSEARLSSDIGGTFTDVVLEANGRRFTHKILTTPEAPEVGLLRGIDEVLSRSGLGMAEIGVLIHGTTLATNAIIERRGASTALVATEGFRDVVVIGTESRYDQYDLYLEKPVPLVPRELRFTVRERIDSRGRVYIPLDEAQILKIALQLKAKKVKSIAIAFLHSYLNPSHEKRAAELLAAALPEVSITTSSDVCPEVREYERTSTAAANAYVQPIISGYLGRMETALKERGFAGSLYIVTSSGGLTSVETARQYPVRLVESGPAGGALFSAAIAAKAHETRVLSFDMGGTTAKVCLVENGAPTTARSFEVDRTARFLKGSGLPLRIPVVEMVEIGAGGGSIAKVDLLGRVVVGPESAASVPGPACYGRGGDKATVTDADLELGLIDAGAFAGGQFLLQAELATKVLSAIGAPLEAPTDVAAYAIYETVCENMASAARAHAAERGAALSEHTMIAFGGAAPLHAARVAEKIGISRVMVPVNAGVGSAVGFLTAPVSYEIVRTRHAYIDETFDSTAISEMLREMREQAYAIVAAAARGKNLVESRIAHMRYVGQGHEIAVRLPTESVSKSDVSQLRGMFEREYTTQFSRVIPNADIEVMSWAVQVSTISELPAAPPITPSLTSVKPRGLRSVFHGELGRAENIGSYRREALSPGSAMSGPCLIEENETTTFVPTTFDAYIDPLGSIVMVRRDES